LVSNSSWMALGRKLTVSGADAPIGVKVRELAWMGTKLMDGKLAL